MNRNTKAIKSYEYLTDWWEDLMTFINPGKNLVVSKSSIYSLPLTVLEGA